MSVKVINRPHFLQLVPVLMGVAVFLFGVVWLITHPDIHPAMLFDDWGFLIDKSLNPPPYVSAFSDFGFVLWIAGGAFCLLAVFALIAIQQQFTMTAGLLTSLAIIGFYLGLDDMMLFHEWLIPYYLHINEFMVQVIYVTLFAIFLVTFRKQLLEKYLALFVMFVILFGVSQGVDFLRDHVLPHPAVYDPLSADPAIVVIEEGPKFLALVFYATYCLNYSVYSLSKIIRKPDTEA